MEGLKDGLVNQILLLFTETLRTVDCYQKVLSNFFHENKMVFPFLSKPFALTTNRIIEHLFPNPMGNISDKIICCN